MAFDITTLKISEIKIVEQTSGKKFTQIFSDDGVDFGGVAVVVWVFERRSNPTVTLAEVEDLTMTELLGKLKLDSDPLEVTA